MRSANSVWGVDTVGDDAKTECDDKKLSDVFYNAMTNLDALKPNIYDKFCQQIDGTKSSKLSYGADGNLKEAPKLKRDESSILDKRTPPPNPDALKDNTFEFAWEPLPGDNVGCSQDVASCRKAFAKLTTSPCGHQGAQMNSMTSAAKISLPNCGTYSWLITGGKAEPVSGDGGGKPTCKFTGDPLTGGCDCTDGTKPKRDEDNRCCVYNQPGGDSTICFNNG